MSLQPQPAYPIPAETRRLAQAACPTGALWLRLVEVLGQLYRDAQLAALFPTRGQPAASPARLALVLVLQYVEGGCRIARPRRPCAAASTGNMLWV
jgi:transposase